MLVLSPKIFSGASHAVISPTHPVPPHANTVPNPPLAGNLDPLFCSPLNPPPHRLGLVVFFLLGTELLTEFNIIAVIAVYLVLIL